MIVVDASVVVKWFVPEVGAAAAKALLSLTDELIAPELVRVEVASALIRRGRRQELAASDVSSTLHAWFRVRSGGADPSAPQRGPHRSRGRDRPGFAPSFADCLYLAVAERLGAALITADRTFVRRMEGRSGQVQLLEEISR